MSTGTTFRLVTPICAEDEAAWKTSATAFFAECRAANKAASDRSIAAILAREAEAAAAAAPVQLRWAA